jgi:hypothetical protein
MCHVSHEVGSYRRCSVAQYSKERRALSTLITYDVCRSLISPAPLILRSCAPKVKMLLWMKDDEEVDKKEDEDEEG